MEEDQTFRIILFMCLAVFLPVGIYHRLKSHATRERLENKEKQKTRIMLEAATVARARAQTTPQIERCIQYLEAIQNTDFAPHRVLGMLTEFSALVGNIDKYGHYRSRVKDYLRTRGRALSTAQRSALDSALERAKARASG